MSETPEKPEKPEIEAIWADKSEEARVTSHLGDNLLGKLILLAAFGVFVLLILNFDPVLSRKF